MSASRNVAPTNRFPPASSLALRPASEAFADSTRLDDVALALVEGEGCLEVGERVGGAVEQVEDRGAIGQRRGVVVDILGGLGCSYGCVGMGERGLGRSA